MKVCLSYQSPASKQDLLNMVNLEKVITGCHLNISFAQTFSFYCVIVFFFFDRLIQFISYHFAIICNCTVCKYIYIFFFSNQKN